MGLQTVSPIKMRNQPLETLRIPDQLRRRISGVLQSVTSSGSGIGHACSARDKPKNRQWTWAATNIAQPNSRCELSSYLPGSRCRYPERGWPLCHRACVPSPNQNEIGGYIAGEHGITALAKADGGDGGIRQSATCPVFAGVSRFLMNSHPPIHPPNYG